MLNTRADRRRPWLTLVGGALIGAALGYLVFFGLPDRDSEPPSATAVPISVGGIEIGSDAPDFELTAITGETLSSSELRGKVVLLNFWATWCARCRAEMPLLQAAYDAQSDQGLVVLGIDFDEPAELVMEFGNELGLTFPLLLDPGGAVQELFRVRGYPTSVVLDREGRVAAYHIGVLAESQLYDYLEIAGLAE